MMAKYKMRLITSAFGIENSQHGALRYSVTLECGHHTVASNNHPMMFEKMESDFYKENNIKARCYECCGGKNK